MEESKNMISEQTKDDTATDAQEYEAIGEEKNIETKDSVLDWEFFDDYHTWDVGLGDFGKRIIKKGRPSGCFMDALIRLNKLAKHSSNYEMKVTLVTELQGEYDNFTNGFKIGVVKVGVGCNGEGAISYIDKSGIICDNSYEIKTINSRLQLSNLSTSTLQKQSIIQFKNEIVKKTNNDENIFQVTVTIDGVEECVLFYQDVEPKVPYLEFGGDDEIELNVEVTNFPSECIQDIPITINDPPSVQIEKLQNNLDLSLKVSKSDSCLSQLELGIELPHDPYLKYPYPSIEFVVEKDIKLWSNVFNMVPKSVFDAFLSKCKTKHEFFNYLIKSLKTFKSLNQYLQIPKLFDLFISSSQEIFTYMSHLDSNSFPLNLDSDEISFRSIFAAMLYNGTDDNKQVEDDSLSSDFTELKQALDISMKYDEYLSEYDNPEKTMISDVLLDDIQSWFHVFDYDYIHRTIQNYEEKKPKFFQYLRKSEKKPKFFQYLIKVLQIYLKKNDSIPPISLYSILKAFCYRYNDVFETIQELYPDKLEILRDSESLEDYDEWDDARIRVNLLKDKSSVLFKPKSTMKLLQTVLTDQYFVDLFCYTRDCWGYMRPCWETLVGKIAINHLHSISWIELVVLSNLISVLSYDLFKKHLELIPPEKITDDGRIRKQGRNCIRKMVKSKDKFHPNNFHFCFMAFAGSCEDIYKLIQGVEPDEFGEYDDRYEVINDNISTNTSLLHTLLSDQLMLDLFCQKSPPGSPFTGQIGGHSWLYHVLENGLFSVISSEFTETYTQQNQSDKFDATKSTAVECISKIIKSKNEINPDHFWWVVCHILFACSNSCQDINDILNDITENEKNATAPNLIFLKSIIPSEQTFVELLIIKSNKPCPFHETINHRPWLSTIIESEQLSQSILSFIFVYMQQDVIDMINSPDERSSDISSALMTLLLDKTDNHRMLRRDFFKILTNVKDCAGAIAYVKNHSNETSIVSLTAVKEIKDIYDFTGSQKFQLFITLLIIFLAGSLSYALDVGSDYSLLYKSYNCTFSNSMNQSMNDIQLKHPSNTTSKCFPTDFCNFTKSSVSFYFQYTLIVCLMPFLLNSLLVVNDTYRNKENSLICLPLSILKHYSIRDKYPHLYHVLCVVQWLIWCPFLILLYPIATKFAYVLTSYMAQITSRSLTGKKQAQDGKSPDKDDEVLEKSFYDKINQSLSSEVIKSSTLEVVTESTLQPLLQLYAITSTCDFSHEFTFGNLFSFSMFSNPLLLSINTSLLAFAWSLMTYHVYVKQGALNTDVGLKARLLMFLYFLAYIISRIFILIISAHQIFGSYENLLFFIILHAFLMCIIHNVHLYKMKIGGNYGSFIAYVKANYKSLGFWIENLINSVGCILIPNNIKYPRREGGKINKRYHEATSFRYLSMHLIFFIENLSLVILCQLNFTELSPLHDVFENPEKFDNGFIKMFPYWSLGLFMLALILKFLYYQSHAWPIPPNCFTLKFLCPFNDIRKGDECRAKENVDRTEESKELLEKEPEAIKEPDQEHVICTEEGIQMGVMDEHTKEMAECFICKEVYNSILCLDEHLSSVHQVDREKLSNYVTRSSNKIPKTEDDVEAGYCCW